MKQLFHFFGYAAVPRFFTMATPFVALAALTSRGEADKYSEVAIFISTSVLLSIFIDFGSFVRAIIDFKAQPDQVEAYLTSHLAKKLFFAAFTITASWTLFFFGIIEQVVFLAAINASFIGVYGIYVFQYRNELHTNATYEIISRSFALLIAMIYFLYRADVTASILVFIISSSVIRTTLFLTLLRRLKLISRQGLSLRRIWMTIKDSAINFFGGISNGGVSDIFVLLSSSLGPGAVAAMSISQYTFKGVRVITNIASTAAMGPVSMGSIKKSEIVKFTVVSLIFIASVIVALNSAMFALYKTGVFYLSVSSSTFGILLVITALASVATTVKAVFDYPLFVRYNISNYIPYGDILIFIFTAISYALFPGAAVGLISLAVIFLCYEAIGALYRSSAFYFLKRPI